jgi:hypothetical protein
MTEAPKHTTALPADAVRNAFRHLDAQPKPYAIIRATNGTYVAITVDPLDIKELLPKEKTA